jgi:DNA-directed RNA polymerase specialized sigma24 family protein
VKSDIRRSSLERVFEDEAERLWWSVLAFGGDREIAHDAVAEAFAQALARGTAIREPAAWIWRAAFKIAKGELKRRRRGEILEDRPYTMPEPLGLFEALERLSPNQRAAVVLHHYSGYRLQEIAKILGTTKGTAGVHLSRGRRRLRVIMEERDG